jgi:pilus assembly protein Flp/PilA
MNAIKNSLARFFKDEEGASAVEYAIILALVAVVIIGFGTQIGEGIKTVFGEIAAGLS